jgi:hypothetical protein
MGGRLRREAWTTSHSSKRFVQSATVRVESKDSLETQNGFIVGSEVLIGNVEHICMMEMIDAIESDYQSHTETVLADGAYATGPNLAQAAARGMELLSPVRQEIAKADNPAYREDLSKPVPEVDLPRLPINSTTKRFDRSAFVYDAEKDIYHCPAGKVLKREGT